MLERATACIESKGCHILRTAPKLPRVQRPLHSSFWCHGVGEIDLPSWWSSSFGHSEFQNTVERQQCGETAKQRLTAGLLGDGFLEFLYPIKTLRLVQKLTPRDARQIQSRTYRQRAPKLLRKLATETLHGGVANNNDTFQCEDDILRHTVSSPSLGTLLKEGDQISVDTRPRSQRRAAQEADRPVVESRHFIQASTSSRCESLYLAHATKVKKVRAVDYRTGKVSQRAVWKNPSQFGLSTAKKTIAHKRMERTGMLAKSMDLKTTPRTRSRHKKIIRYSAEAHQLDNDSLESFSALQKRIHSVSPVLENDLLKVFYQISQRRRSARHYTKAILAAASIPSYRQLRFLLKGALIRFADFPTSPKGLPFIVRHLVVNQQWVALTCVCELVWNRRVKPGHDPIGHDIFDKINGLTFTTLMWKAKVLAKCARYASASLDSQKGWKASRNRRVNPQVVRKIATILALRCLRRKQHSVDVSVHTSMFEAFQSMKTLTTEHYHLAMWQLLTSETGDRSHAASRRAVDIYGSMRQRKEIIPGKPLLDRLMSVLLRIHDTARMQEVFGDYRRFHGVPRAKIFVQMMHEMAHLGQSRAFYKLFDEYLGHFGNPSASTGIYHCMLTLHSRRFDIAETVRIFESFPAYGFRPDILCWNTVLRSYANIFDLDGALAWYDRLLASKTEPSVRTLTILANLHATRGDISAVEKLIRTWQRPDGKMPASLICSRVSAYVRCNRLEEAQKMVIDALAIDVQGSRTQMWNVLLNAIATYPGRHVLQPLMTRMEEVGVPADGMTYAALMHAYVEQYMPWAAYRVIKAMGSKGIQPTAFHYTIAMKGFLTTHEYELVFAVYQKLLRAEGRSNPDAEVHLLKATVLLDRSNARRTIDGVKQPFALPNADALLDRLIPNLDPEQMAVTGPIRRVGIVRIHDDRLSGYFSFPMLIYSEHQIGDRVEQLYQQYLEACQRFQPGADVDPPLRILAALINHYRHQGLYDDVERCWQRAVAKCERLLRRPGTAPSDGDRILPSHRFTLALPLRKYMYSLMSERRIDDLRRVVAQLRYSGYDLTNDNWNTYVHGLLRGGAAYYEEAFAVAETQLMGDWTRWPRGTHVSRILREMRRKMPSSVMRPAVRRPQYVTLVYLAGAYLEHGSMEGLRKEGEEEGWGGNLWRVAPKTVRAIYEMPRIDKGIQEKVLRRR